MDTGKGFFKPTTEKKFNEQMKTNEPMVFKVGEILKIKGSYFRVEKMLRKKIILKLLPKKQRQEPGK